MHPDDSLNTVQHDLRNSAKGSNDAYDVTVSLTRTGWRFLPINQTNNFVFVSALGAARRLKVVFSFFLCSGSRFRLPEISIPWQSTGGCHHVTFEHVQSLHSLLALHSHIHHETRLAQDKDCVLHENTSPSCASCFMP